MAPGCSWWLAQVADLRESPRLLYLRVLHCAGSSEGPGRGVTLVVVCRGAEQDGERPSFVERTTVATNKRGPRFQGASTSEHSDRAAQSVGSRKQTKVKDRKHECFRCGEPTTCLIYSLGKRADARYICQSRECAEAWWALRDTSASG